MVFTTQEQLFAHFAKEHVGGNGNAKTENHQNVTIYKDNDNINESSVAPVSYTPTGLQVSDQSHNNLQRDDVGNAFEGTTFSVKASSESGIQQHLMSKVGIATPPQLQHSCPVCHKVRPFLNRPK